ncbi:hypothetical protein AAEH85_22615, partial [Shewanella algae]
ARFHSARLKTKLYQLLSDTGSGFFTSPATPEMLFTDMDKSIEKGTVCKDHRFGCYFYSH